MIGKTNAIGDVNGCNPYAQLINYTFLYDEGDECIDITGGWSEYNRAIDTWGTIVTPTLTKGASSMTASIADTTSKQGLIATANKILWSNYSGKVFVHGLGNSNIASNSNAKIVSPTQLATQPTGNTGSIPTIHYAPQKLNGSLVADVSPTQDNYIGINLAASGSNISVEIFHLALLKNDDWTTWMTKGGVSGFATLEALLADAAAMETLMTNQDAINFMVRQCTGNVMTSVLVTPTSKNALLNSADAFEACAGNEHWFKFLDMVI